MLPRLTKPRARCSMDSLEGALGARAWSLKWGSTQHGAAGKPRICLFNCLRTATTSCHLRKTGRGVLLYKKNLDRTPIHNKKVTQLVCYFSLSIKCNLEFKIAFWCICVYAVAPLAKRLLPKGQSLLLKSRPPSWYTLRLCSEQHMLPSLPMHAWHNKDITNS